MSVADPRLRARIGRDPSASAGTGYSLVRLLAAVAALAGVLLYLNALDNPFIYDDYDVVADNPTLQDLSNWRAIVLRNITRPLVNVFYAFDTAIWGHAPFGYHLTNVLLHAFNILLVYRLALAACEDRRSQQGQDVGAAASSLMTAFAAALVFAVHPMMAQAVGYITGRSDLAHGFLFLLGFLAGRRWMLSGGMRWWIACTGLWAAGVLTKEPGVMLPFMLVAYDWFVLDAPPGERRRRLLRLELPLIVLTMAAGVVRILVLRWVEHSDFPVDWRFSIVAADAFWRYLELFAFPHDLALFHAMNMPDESAPLRMIAGVVGVVIALAALWRLRRVHSIITFGGLWFLLMLFPSSVLFAAGVGEPLAERRGYVAAAGLFLAWGSMFAILWRRSAGRRTLRAVVATGAVLFVAQLSAQTFVRNELWSDPVLVAEESVALAPDHWLPWMLLADALRQDGRCADAIPAYRKVIALRPNEKPAYAKITGCLIQAHAFEEAEDLLLQLKAIDPSSPGVAVKLGVLAVIRNDRERARAYFTESIERHPEQQEAQHLLAFVNGSLAGDEQRAFCEYFHAMDDSFDLTACLVK